MEGMPSRVVSANRVSMKGNKDYVSHRVSNNAKVIMLGGVFENFLHKQYTIFHSEITQTSRMAVN